MSTGKNSVYETYSKKDDTNYGFDEVFRIIQTFDPKETVIIKKNITQTDQFLINYLDLSKRVTHFKEHKQIKRDFFELIFQKTLEKDI